MIFFLNNWNAVIQISNLSISKVNYIWRWEPHHHRCYCFLQKWGVSLVTSRRSGSSRVRKQSTLNIRLILYHSSSRLSLEIFLDWSVVSKGYVSHWTAVIHRKTWNCYKVSWDFIITIELFILKKPIGELWLLENPNVFMIVCKMK